jgi:hydrogenase maturation factor
MTLNTLQFEMMCMPISKQRVLELHTRLKKKYACQDGLKMQNEENKHDLVFVGIKIVWFEC